MNAYASLPLALAVLLTVLPAAPPVFAHSEGPRHGHADDSKATAQQSSDSGMYRWKDDRGMVHYSQGLQSVPERFRDAAVPLGQATTSPPQPGK